MKIVSQWRLIALRCQHWWTLSWAALRVSTCQAAGKLLQTRMKYNFLTFTVFKFMATIFKFRLSSIQTFRFSRTSMKTFMRPGHQIKENIPAVLQILMIVIVMSSITIRSWSKFTRIQMKIRMQKTWKRSIYLISQLKSQFRKKKTEFLFIFFLIMKSATLRLLPSHLLNRQYLRNTLLQVQHLQQRRQRRRQQQQQQRISIYFLNRLKLNQR